MRSTLCLCTATLLAAGSPAAAATWTVHAGDNLQTTLNAAKSGDEIRLQPGATFSGNFVLPVFSGTTYVTVRTDLPDASLPAATQRITPALAQPLAKIVSPNNEPAIRTAAGAHHWKLAFLELPANRDGYGDIIELGDGSSAQAQLSQVPFELVLDHLYVHGDPLTGQKRGVALNAATVTIRNCYISDIKAVGIDTQAIGGWNGPGPFSIENNYLEAAGEVFMLGGSDPSIPNLVSSDVGVRSNYFSRPMAWRDPIIATPGSVTAANTSGGSLPPGTYTYAVVARRPVGQGTTGHSAASANAAVGSTSGAVRISWSAVSGASDYQVFGRGQVWTTTGTTFVDSGAAGTAGSAPTDATRWQVKNIFELKNARRVTAEFNVFENNWQAAQPGWGIVFTPRNQDGHCPWCVIDTVAFMHNIVRNTTAGVNILGYDSPNPSQQATHITISDNLFYGITTALGGNGWGFQVGVGPSGVTIDHNTIDADGSTLLYAYGGTASAPTPVTGFVFTNNVARANTYGINGDGASPGTVTIQRYFPGGTLTGNWLSGAPSARYPAGNRFDAPFDAGFRNRAAGDYLLVGDLASPGSDGRVRGADLAKLTPLLTNVPNGVMVGVPQPPRNVHIISGGG